jgi:hypothetical protein
MQNGYTISGLTQANGFAINSPACKIKIKINKEKSESTQNGTCSYLLFPHNRGKIAHFSTKKNLAECVESVEEACRAYCDKTTEEAQPDNTIFALKVNFGKRPNFDQFHMPFSNAEGIALADCNSTSTPKYGAKVELAKEPNF